VSLSDAHSGDEVCGPIPTAPRRAETLGTSKFWLGLTLAVVVFGGLAYLARSIPYWEIDLALTRAIQSVEWPLFGVLLGGISWIGFPPQFPIFCTLVVVGLSIARHWREALTVAATSAGAASLWFSSTRLIDRPRPDPALVRVAGELHGGSFPSGHVLTNVAIFGVLTFLVYVRFRPSVLRTLTMLLLGLPIVVVGVARLYAGQHWPSDVLGGYLLGGIWLAVVIHRYERYVRAE